MAQLVGVDYEVNVCNPAVAEIERQGKDIAGFTLDYEARRAVDLGGTYSADSRHPLLREAAYQTYHLVASNHWPQGAGHPPAGVGLQGNFPGQELRQRLGVAALRRHGERRRQPLAFLLRRTKARARGTHVGACPLRELAA